MTIHLSVGETSEVLRSCMCIFSVETIHYVMIETFDYPPNVIESYGVPSSILVNFHRHRRFYIK